MSIEGFVRQISEKVPKLSPNVSGVHRNFSMKSLFFTNPYRWSVKKNIHKRIFIIRYISG